MKKYIIGLILIVIVSLVGIRVFSKINNSAETVIEVKPITVEGEQVRKGTISDYAILTGTIEAEQTVSIIPTIPAIVEKLEVEAGDEVKTGDLLFQLETDDIENQVTQAGASVDQASVSIKSAEETAKQAQASYEMAKANYDMGYEQYLFSRENLAKYEQLYNEGVISEVEFKQMKLQASESTLELLNKQLEQAAISRDQALLAVENARAMATQAQAGYSTATNTLSDTTFTAPINGYVSSINVVESMFASSAQPAMVIHAIDRVHINVNVTETLVNKLSKGQEVDVIISSLEDKAFTGTLKTVSPAADAMSKLYAITIEVENKDHEIKPGMFANVKLRTEEKSNALHVKAEAVSFEEGKNFVYVQKQESAIERKEVEVGMDNGEFIEIKKGLDENDVYIYKGIGFLEEDSIITMVRGDQ
jgi:RND family efflux transporter MFP subunit